MSLFRLRPRLLALVALLVTPALALTTVTSAAPANAQKIRPSYWGMHDGDWTTPPAVPVGSANFTTTGTYWPNIETSKGHYDFTRLDQQVSAAKHAHAQPMILLGRTPKFHSTKHRSDDYADYMPKVKAWKKYVTKVAKRYGKRIDYQIWPEPNIVQNWKGSPRQMAKLTMVAAKAIQRAAGKKARVVSPAVALRLPGQREWTMKYFKQKFHGTRVHKVLDAIAIDPFPKQKGTPEGSFRIMKSIKKKLGHIGVHTPIWNNEINYGVAGGGATTHTKYRRAKQQSYVIRTYALSAAAKMQRTYWLGWFNNHQLAVSMTDADGAALAPARSYEAVRSWLNWTKFQGCDQKKHGLWVCTAKKGHKEVRRIYWKTKGHTTIKTPRSTKRVEDRNGKVISHKGSHKIRVNYRPIMVASRK